MPRFSRRQRIALLAGPVVGGAGMRLRQDRLLGLSLIADPLQGWLMGVGVGV